jgi:hypothetical protein
MYKKVEQGADVVSLLQLALKRTEGHSSYFLSSIRRRESFAIFHLDELGQ